MKSLQHGDVPSTASDDALDISVCGFRDESGNRSQTCVADTRPSDALGKGGNSPVEQALGPEPECDQHGGEGFAVWESLGQLAQLVVKTP